MTDDWTLLQRHAHEGSRESLDEVVRRYLPMVYAAALRQTGDPHLAEDCTQVVFLVLMRRAASIPGTVLLGGWLFHATSLTVAKFRRSDRRRQHHERKAGAMRPAAAVSSPSEKDHAPPGILDIAIAELPPPHRDALVMRYVQGRGISDIARTLRITENTARQRIFRALTKLRTKLRKKGVRSEDMAIGASLLASATHAPPPLLSTRVLTTLHSSAANAWSPAAGTVVRMMIMAKLKTTALASLTLLLLLSAGSGLVYLARPHNHPPQPPLQISQQPPPAPPPASAPLQPAPNTPNATLANVLHAVATGDADTLVTSFDALDATQEAALRAAARGMAAATELRAAVTTRFGDQATQWLFDDLRIDPPPALPVLIARISPTYAGNTAQLDIPEIGILSFVKVGDTWKLSATTLQSNFDFFSQFADAAPVFSRTASQIKTGHFQEVQSIQTELQSALAAARADPAGGPPDHPALLGPGKTPKETIAALAWAQLTGNEDAAIACFMDLTPEQQAGLRMQVQLFHAGEQIRSAIAETFGPTAARNSLLALGLDSGLSKQLLDSIPALDNPPTADHVQVDLPKIGATFNLTHSARLWKIEPAPLGLGTNPRWQSRLRDHYLPAYQQLARDIHGGTYTTPEKLQTAVTTLHQELAADHQQYFAGK